MADVAPGWFIHGTTTKPVKLNHRAHAARGTKGGEKMKRLIVLALFLSQAAFADDYYTPQQIKHDINTNLLFTSPTTLAWGTGYVNGVINSIKTVQNLNLVPRNVCLIGGSIEAALNAVDISQFPATNQGGTMYIYYALFSPHAC